MYTKIYQCLLDSSVWQQQDSTRVVWITLLLMMDEDGVVRMGSVAALARRANVTEAAARVAVKFLEAPDPDAKDQEDQGVRLQRLNGGWLVVKGEQYRQMKTRQDVREQNRQRKQKQRAREKEYQLQFCQRDERDICDIEGHVTPVAKSHTSEQNRTDKDDRCINTGEGDNFVPEATGIVPEGYNGFAAIPAEEDVLSWNEVHLKADPEWIKASYQESVGVGWIDRRNRRIVAWKSYFTGIWRAKLNLANDRRTGSGAPDPVSKGGMQGRGAASTAFALREKLKGAEATEGELRGKRDRLAVGPLASDRDRAKRAEINEQIKDLREIKKDIQRRLSDLEVPE